LLSLRTGAPDIVLRDAQFDTIHLCLIKVARARHEMVTRIQLSPCDRLSLPGRFTALAGKIAKLPP